MPCAVISYLVDKRSNCIAFFFGRGIFEITKTRARFRTGFLTTIVLIVVGRSLCLRIIVIERVCVLVLVSFDQVPVFDFQGRDVGCGQSIMFLWIVL